MDGVRLSRSLQPRNCKILRQIAPSNACPFRVPARYAAEFIQKFLGHSSTTITMDTYGTFSLGEMQQMIASKTGDRLPARNPHMKGLHQPAPARISARLGRGP